MTEVTGILRLALADAGKMSSATQSLLFFLVSLVMVLACAGQFAVLLRDAAIAELAATKPQVRAGSATRSQQSRRLRAFWVLL